MESITSHRMYHINATATCSERDPAEVRQCGLCGMPQAASEFSVRSTPSPNCRRCERAYNMLHFHERLSMPVVRGNIHALGGPGLLVSTYKREGLRALDLNQNFTQRRSRRSTRSDGHAEGTSQGTGEIAEDAKPAGEKQEEGQAPASSSPAEAGNDDTPTAEQLEETKVKDENKTSEAADPPEESMSQHPQITDPKHTTEELDVLRKHGGIKIIQTDHGSRFVYKRKRVDP